MKNIKVFTNSTFNDTIEIVSYLEPVTYHIVLGVNFFADWLSSWTDFLGGKSQSYQTRLAEINKEVIEGIQRKVYQIGGNAAIDLKIDNDEISAQGKSMIMVTAIATAVVIKEKEKIKSENNLIPKKGIRAITNQEYLKHRQKQEYKKTIIESKQIGPLNRLLPEIKSEHYDLIIDLFKSVNNGDFSPRDFLQESRAVILNMTRSIDSELKPGILYENLKFIGDENNEVDYRILKGIFYLNLIEDTNCVDYNCINEILPQASERLREHIIEHYIRGLDMKSIFYPNDIEYLGKGLKILEELEVNKSEYSEVFTSTINRLQELFN